METNKNISVRGINKILYTVAIFVSLLLLTKTNVFAAEAYTVTPANVYLYSGAGAELYTQPDFGTYYTSVNGNLPVLVTGVTSNGFFQIDVAGKPYYVYKNALANCKGTTAYKYSTFDSTAFVVGDLASGKIYSAKAGNVSVPCASTTKIMTAMLTIEAINNGQLSLDTPVIVSKTALSTLPSDASHMDPKLKEGEVLTICSLLEACLIKSDCQACHVLAEAVSGSVPAFVQLMNARAVQLGCTGTHFVNPSGYPEPNHFSTANDLFLITRQAMVYPVFSTIVKMPSCIIPATNLTSARPLVNSNSLIIPTSNYYNPTCIGVKTGSASSSGLCLVSAASQNGKTVVSVVLGGRKKLMSDGTYCYGQYYDSNRLLSYGLSQ